MAPDAHFKPLDSSAAEFKDFEVMNNYTENALVSSFSIVCFTCTKKCTTLLSGFFFGESQICSSCTGSLTPMRVSGCAYVVCVVIGACVPARLFL